MTRRFLRSAAWMLASALAVTGCAGDRPTLVGPASSPAASSASAPASSAAAPSPSSPTPRPVPGVALGTTAATGLAVPWGMAFLPDRSALVAQRDNAQVVAVAPDGAVTQVGTVPGVQHGGEGGLLGLAVSPTFVSDRLVYAYLTTDRDNRVVRMRLDGGRLGPADLVIGGIPRGTIHNGGRLVFGPDGNLWIGTGETGDRPLAQDRSSLAGKILHVRPDGGIPGDNPFPGSPVWSLGHRNVQGLAFDSRGRLWASEFGSQFFDELNLIVRGGNYGWPVVEGAGGDRRWIDPQVTWKTPEASPSGIAVVDDVVYVASLRGSRLWQVPVRGERAGAPKAWLIGTLGRLRTVEPAPDGGLWLTTSNRDGRGDPRPDDDRIARVTLTP